MITNIIVFASLALAVAFAVAWVARPKLRAWIERPKYQFQDAVQEYDRAQRAPSPPEEKATV
jgi:hypothetical protein